MIIIFLLSSLLFFCQLCNADHVPQLFRSASVFGARMTPQRRLLEKDSIVRLPSGEPADPSDAYQECYDFLTEYMPQRDVAMMSDILLNNTITFALMARNRFSYAQSVPWDIFLNNVLPYCMMNEARDHWRQYFYKLFAPVADQFDSYSNVCSLSVKFLNV